MPRPFGRSLRNWHPISKLTAALGLAAVGLLWWTDDRQAGGTTAATRPATVHEAKAPDLPPPVTRTLPDLASFHAMVERPLFTVGRRTRSPDSTSLAAESAAPPAAPPALRFVGSIEQDGAVHAVIEISGSRLSLGVGQAIDDWHVLEIDHHRLLLGIADQRREFVIFN